MPSLLWELKEDGCCLFCTYGFVLGVIFFQWSKREPALNIPNSVIYVEYRKQFLDKIIK